MDRAKSIYKVTIISIITNVFLAIFKASFGVIFHSYALVSDAIHSLSDVFSAFVVIIGSKFANKEKDDDHNYGHQKYESIAGIVLSMFLFVTAILIIKTGIERIILINDGEVFQSPNKFALYCALVSVLVKEAMYRYTIIVATKIKSPALKADAWHHRTDALASVGSFLAIIGSMNGYVLADPVISIVIGFLILKVSWSIAKESIDQVTDKAVDKETYDAIKQEILSVDGVISIDSLKTRVHASKIYVDVSIFVDEDLSVAKGHEISEVVHDSIEKDFTDVLHIMVHVKPCRLKSK